MIELCFMNAINYIITTANRSHVVNQTFSTLSITIYCLCWNYTILCDKKCLHFILKRFKTYFVKNQRLCPTNVTFWKWSKVPFIRLYEPKHIFWCDHKIWETKYKHETKLFSLLEVLSGDRGELAILSVFIWFVPTAFFACF